MIDTIQIGIQDYEIQDEDRLIERNEVDHYTGETRGKFYYNDDVVNLDINNRGLAIRTTLAKMYGLGDFNLYPLGVNSFVVGIENLKEKLKEIGIIADIKKAKVWRLDLFDNIRTKYPYQVYKPILEMLNLKRTHSRQYPDGYMMGNTLREIIFYNKVKELKRKIGDAISEMGFNREDIMRGEVRFLKAREVRKHGIEYVKDIPENWQRLKETYRNYMREVFKYDFKGAELKITKTWIDSAMFSLVNEGKEAIKKFGFYTYAFVNRNELLSALLNVYSRARAYAVLSKIEKYKKELEMDYRQHNLYKELKTKFLEGR